ncbi:hypothetical protein [Streptomyces sp. AC550_RSS872]|uniref:hypothetical protein n=1 Tax=Streptomyces sp. AC550_RSS872 TaxID=2823689 RepID=UPI001C25BF8C|nr:hypothetical protein [Streptomyces sp. AC550_RSS872]
MIKWKFGHRRAGREQAAGGGTAAAAPQRSAESRDAADHITQSVAQGAAAGVARTLTQKVWESVFGD